MNDLFHSLLLFVFGFRSRSKKGGANWSEEEEDELQRLHQEFKDIQDPGEANTYLLLSNSHLMPPFVPMCNAILFQLWLGFRPLKSVS